jgi:uncharacterized RDD family membrane protein YckC
MSPDPSSYLASSQKRSVAYFIDLCASALFLVPSAFATYLLGTPDSGALEVGLIFFVYQAYFLYFKDGVTFGKYIHNIAVVSLDGSPLKLNQVLVRALSLSVPWLLLAAGDSSLAKRMMPYVSPGLLPTVGMAWLLLDVVLIEFLRTRRSMTDHVAGTVVVNLPPPQPHRAPAAPMFSASDAEFGTAPRRPPSPPTRRSPSHED